MHSAFLQDLVHVLDWVGTFVFALSGGLLGIQKRFDLFGVRRDGDREIELRLLSE